ncbi:hypothetical protein NM688_g4969 [Phlebia brevispora]|uniref:Uncharacterized protein n=1 Tax=Phlebia brevispora TaxID=194682 RepID=A0ACC1T1M0_9APHY|nr:hypothetical protein NM688_g4969 [Phlebia brevispora]
MDDPELTAPELKPPLRNSAAPRDKEPQVDLAKLQKWQEERLARILKGEYESATLRLAEVVNDNLDAPLRITSIRVDGATHTRKSFIGSIVAPHLAPGPDIPIPAGTTKRHRPDLQHKGKVQILPQDLHGDWQ